MLIRICLCSAPSILVSFAAVFWDVTRDIPKNGREGDYVHTCVVLLLLLLLLLFIVVSALSYT